MGDLFPSLSERDREFIEEQKVFFIASASGAEVNLSPKGLDSFRIIGPQEALFLDYPGSGNRTGRDVAAGGKVTIMFTAFTGSPNILRLFCSGENIEKNDARFAGYLARFKEEDPHLVRRIIRFTITQVESSCGISIPRMNYVGERTEFMQWAVGMRDKGKLDDYIRDHQEPPAL